MAIIQVGETEATLVDLPSPKAMTVNLMDIDSGTTTRSANGKVLRDRICGGATAKRKLELTFAPSDGTKVKTVLQSIKNVFFYVRYPDPYEGDMRTARFYAGDRKVPMYSFNLHGQGIIWDSYTVNFVEE